MTNTQATTPELGELKKQLRSKSDWLLAYGLPQSAKTMSDALVAIERLSRPVGDDVVERVARAICKAGGSDPDALLEGKPIWDHYEDEAKAAIAALSSIPVSTEAGEALVRTQEMLETIDRTNSTNFREVRERIIANRVALSAIPTEKVCGDIGAGLCAACDQPVGDLTQHPGCGGPLPSRPAGALATAEPSTDDEWAARDLARAIRLKVTTANWREGELIAMCMEALRDHRLAHSGVGNVVELKAALQRTTEHLRSFADYYPDDRTTETEAIFWCNNQLLSALSTTKPVELQTDREKVLADLAADDWGHTGDDIISINDRLKRHILAARAAVTDREKGA